MTAMPAGTIADATATGVPAPTTLVLGGARSGKSCFAEHLVTSGGCRRIYVATAEANDTEMAERIRLHRKRRGDGWQTVEEPIDLAGRIAELAAADAMLLVDCLTLWVSNLLAAGSDIDAATVALIASLSRAGGAVVLVSNEVGLGIVPDNPLARAFRDHAGRVNQAVAEVAQRVYFVAAGLPLTLKDDIVRRRDSQQ